MFTLFTYGTLMYQPLWLNIVSHQHVPTPALLNDFCRCRIKGALSCSLVPAAGGHVTGMLYGGLSEADIRSLDDYTADLFERVVLKVSTPKEDHEVFSYVIKPELHYRLELREWDQRQFELLGLRHLLAAPISNNPAVFS